MKTREPVRRDVDVDVNLYYFHRTFTHDAYNSSVNITRVYLSYAPLKSSE